MALEEDVKYPMNEEGWIKTVAFGSVLEYLSFLIVPGWILMGYYVRVCRQRLDGDPEPPSFDDPMALLVDGIKTSVIFWAYNIVTILAFLFLVVGAVLNALNGDFWAALGSILFGLFVTLVLAVVFSYAGTAGVVRFAETGSMAAAFSPSLAKFLISPTWFVTWVKLIAVASLFGFATGIVSFIPLVGQILAAILVPATLKYVGTVSWKMLTDAYAEVLDIDVSPTVEPSATAD